MLGNSLHLLGLNAGDVCTKCDRAYADKTNPTLLRVSSSSKIRPSHRNLNPKKLRTCEILFMAGKCNSFRRALFLKYYKMPDELVENYDDLSDVE